MRTNCIAVLLLSAALTASASGCQKPEPETKDASGHLQFPNTGRQPTQEEINKILADRQKSQAGASAPGAAQKR